MTRIIILPIFMCLLLLTPVSCPGQEPPETMPNAQDPRLDPHWCSLIDRLAEDGLDKERMTQLFSDLNLPWSPVFMATKVQELYGTRLGAEANVKVLPGQDVRPLDYMPPAASGFEGAKGMLTEHAPLLVAVQQRYGTPPALIAAILLLESDMGHELGEGLALHALASMAVTTTPEQALQGIEGYRQPQPALRKNLEKSIRAESARAYKELCALIRYCETSGVDILHVPGSVYGAIGLCHFMPGNINVYGVDSDNKGIIDLFGVSDAAHSIGNLLKEQGFAAKLPIKKQVAILRRYNPSDGYAELALGMSYQLTGKRVPAELSMFAARGARKAWWPKMLPGYRLPSLGTYTIK